MFQPVKHIFPSLKHIFPRLKLKLYPMENLFSTKGLLITGKAPVDEPLSGCQTVYRYYDQYPDEWNKGDNGGTEPEITR